MKRKVAIYARVSTEHEAQLSALENQIQYYDDLLAKHPEWELYDKYIDEGITGTSVKKRKNFMRMLEDARNGCFDLIVTREVSRFARNTVDTLQETRKLKKMGVEVFFIEDNIWTHNDEDGELRLTIMATLAQNESKKTSQRVKAGMKISYENGVVYGTGNILGYDRVGKEMVINKEQAETVKMIFELYLKGYGSKKIADHLEKLGRLTATGLKKWECVSINRTLRNPFYCGTIVYRKSYVPDFLEQKAKKNIGEVEQVIVEGKHEPIISKEDFKKVQEILDSKAKSVLDNKPKSSGVRVSVWSKKLLCSCGNHYNKSVYHKYDTYKTYNYLCYNQKNNGSYDNRKKKGLDTTGACSTPYVQEWKLVLMANIIFTKLLKDKERLIEICNSIVNEAINKKKNMTESEFNEENVGKRINANCIKIENLLDMCLNGYISKDEYKKKREEIEKSNVELMEMKKKFEIENNIADESVKDRVKRLCGSIKERLKDNNQTSLEQLVEDLVDTIIVHNEHFEWKLKIIDDKKANNKEILFTRLSITKDDVDNYYEKKIINEKGRICQPILADIFV